MIKSSSPRTASLPAMVLLRVRPGAAHVPGWLSPTHVSRPERAGDGEGPAPPPIVLGTYDVPGGAHVPSHPTPVLRSTRPSGRCPANQGTGRGSARGLLGFLPSFAPVHSAGIPSAQAGITENLHERINSDTPSSPQRESHSRRTSETSAPRKSSGTGLRRPVRTLSGWWWWGCGSGWWKAGRSGCPSCAVAPGTRTWTSGGWTACP